ncbi:ATP-binding cassette domain-containing protein [Campylobacter sp. CCUG 57310]|uniref:ATP-binding cassette domain-containing protein n=1 Tax=Campylobacter sp. CCUG 57310 TaxID=2517362 RepID=UPI0015633AF3|nr:ATP-binding cassette domain-containing protein [Campylobacter sp. CCUG 57310]QKF91678.1 monosaccharide ABC transporter, ATP-binding protein [Campylobacter sp. CCUG 57310]
MASDNAIELKNAFKSFGNTKILKGINFNLKKGETIALLGDNGAGKSTLIKCLCGYDRFDKFDSFSVLDTPIKKGEFDLLKARNLGMEVVFQDSSLGLSQEIYRNIFATRHITKFGLIDKKKEIEISNQILKEFMGFSGAGIDATSLASNLSGGEKQGLAIARAIYFKSQILILDEPTTALGVNETERFMGFLDKLKEQNLSIIIITHNLNQAFHIADKFVLLRSGVIEQELDKSEISDLNSLYKVFYE